MQFERRQGWRVSFQDTKDSRLSFREFTFTDPAKIEELVARTATQLILEDWHLFENGLQNGRGTVTLTLTEKQYRLLLR